MQDVKATDRIIVTINAFRLMTLDNIVFFILILIGVWKDIKNPGVNPICLFSLEGSGKPIVRKQTKAVHTCTGMYAFECSPLTIQIKFSRFYPTGDAHVKTH